MTGLDWDLAILTNKRKKKLGWVANPRRFILFQMAHILEINTAERLSMCNSDSLHVPPDRTVVMSATNFKLFQGIVFLSRKGTLIWMFSYFRVTYLAFWLFINFNECHEILINY